MAAEAPFAGIRTAVAGHSLVFNERDVLKNAGRVSAEIAQQLALGEYAKFERTRITAEAQAPDDDFEQAAKQLGRKKANKPGRGEPS